MKSTLDYRDAHLCVLNELELSAGRAGGPRNIVREWFAVREAAEAEVASLVGRPVEVVESEKGLYVDEEGNPYHLAHRVNAKPLAVEKALLAMDAAQPQPRNEAQTSAPAASADDSAAIAAKARQHRVTSKPLQRKRKGQAGSATKADRGAEGPGSETPQTATRPPSAERGRGPQPRSPVAANLNLRQKLAEVRRRIGYIQKRGHNERQNYRYVTAADIAGAVGDILAELGVVVIPSLESVSYVPTRNAAGQVERVARVVMTYAFTDAENGEAIVVKVPGEGLDVGDKATYKAMTGALKYALLQSFLLASGEDPEDDRHEVHHRGAATPAVHSERKVNAAEIAELKQLIDDTATELERVLAYYKVSSLDEMTEPVYRRAVELLGRKRAVQTRREASHAQG
jgi:hypothetical protein